MWCGENPVGPRRSWKVCKNLEKGVNSIPPRFRPRWNSRNFSKHLPSCDRLWFATVLACRIPMRLHMLLNQGPTNCLPRSLQMKAGTSKMVSQCRFMAWTTVLT